MNIVLSILIYLLFAAGAVGLYLGMPRKLWPFKYSEYTSWVGLGIGCGAIAGLMALLICVMGSHHAGNIPAGDVKVGDWLWQVGQYLFSNIFFYLFAGIGLFAAGRVITHRKPVYSALYFVLVILAVAALLIMAEAEFLGMALVIIYAGAILVTYMFVIMLAHQSQETEYDTRAREPLVAIMLSFIAMGAIAGQAVSIPDKAPEPVTANAMVAQIQADIARADAEGSAKASKSDSSNTQEIGELFMGPYIVAVELAGLLLLVALFGAVALAKKKVTYIGPPLEEREIGKAGKEVVPFANPAGVED